MASELPDSDDTARLPCLAMGTPAAAATIAVAVEMLNVPCTSPPVPQVSIVPGGASTATHPRAHGAHEAGQLLRRLAAHRAAR